MHDVEVELRTSRDGVSLRVDGVLVHGTPDSDRLARVKLLRVDRAALLRALDAAPIGQSVSPSP